MRFRLRTLMIAITIAAVAFAWTHYVWRMERFHRLQESKYIDAITATESALWTGVDTTNLQRGEYASVMIDSFVNRDGRAVGAYEEGAPRITESGQLYFRGLYATVPGDTGNWELAIHHRLIADKYHRALFQPWILLSK